MHGQHERHLIALPRMPRRREVRAIERHVLTQLRQGRGRRPGIDRHPQIADVREALGRMDGDADRRVRPLERARHHRDVLDLVVGAVIAEALLGPRPADDLERLVEASAVFRHGHAEAMELARNRASAHAELEATAGEQVRRRGLLGAAQRVVERQQGHGRPDANPACALGDHRHDHERARQQRERAAEVQLRQPRHVEAERVAERDQVEHLGVALGVRLSVRFRRLIEEPESHGGRLLRSPAPAPWESSPTAPGRGRRTSWPRPGRGASGAPSATRT